jgi:hypothetical protein
MRPFPRLLLVAALALAACHAPPVTKPSPRASKPVVTEASPRAASPTPPAPTPAAPVSLQAPTDAYVALAGTVKVDASYLLGTARTSLVGADAVAVGDAGLLANNGGNLVAGLRGGAAIANADGTFLAAGNAGILANNGGNLISDHGGGIVANNGGGIVSDHGAARHLLAAPAAGTLLPAGGLVVSAVSLRTQQYVPVGVGPGGAPAYAVYSDAAGAYKLFVPASEQGNVAVVANVPGSQDAKLVYNTIVPVQASADAAMDDDAAVATRMIRRALAGQIALIITAADNQSNVKAITEDDTVPHAFQDGLVRVVTALNQQAHDLNVPTGPAALDQPEVQALSRALADVVLSYIQLDQVKLDTLLAPDWQGPHEPLFLALDKVFGHLREATRAYMQARLDAGQHLPLTVPVGIALQDELATHDCVFEDRVPVATPADLGVYLVDDLLSRQHANAFFNTKSLFQAVRLPGQPDPNDFADGGKTYQESERLRACTSVLFAYFALTLAPPDSTAEAPAPAFASVLATQAAYAKAHAFTAPPSPRPRIGQGQPCNPNTKIP